MSEDNIQINVEQILAAVLNKVGKVVMKTTELVQDFGSFAVAVNPIGEDDLEFSLVDAGVIEDESE